MATNAGVGGDGANSKFTVTKEVASVFLYSLRANTILPRLFAHDYNAYWRGANKIGKQLVIKKPFKVKATKGRVLTTSPLIDDEVVMSLNIDYCQGFEYDVWDATVGLKHFMSRYFTEGIAELGQMYDEEGAKELHKGIYFMDGTVGSSISIESVQNLRAHWASLYMPNTVMRISLLNPYERAALSVEMKDLANEHEVSSAIHGAFTGGIAGFRGYETTHLPDYSISDYGNSTPLVNYNVAGDTSYEGSSLPTDGWAISTKVLFQGQLITIKGVNEIQPRGGRKSHGILQSFVVAEDITSDANGRAVIKVEPEINAGTLTVKANDGATDLSRAAYQTVDSAAANNATINIVGAGVAGANKGKSFRQSIFCIPKTLQFLNVQIEEMQSLNSKTIMDTESGLSIHLVTDGSIDNLKEKMRLTIFAGAKVIRPDIGIRLITSEIGGS